MNHMLTDTAHLYWNAEWKKADAASPWAMPEPWAIDHVSTLRPGSSTVTPLTVTRPAAMRSSDTRRDATPAAAMTFCNRSPSGFSPFIETVRTVGEKR